MQPTRPIFLYKADPARGHLWAEIFRTEAPELDFRLWPEASEAAEAERVHFLATWQPPDRVAERFPRLRVLFSTGAGVDQFDLAALPPSLPLVRMIEPGIVQGMVEYVTHAVLDLHRDMPAYRRLQAQRAWQPLRVCTAGERRVGVLGLGSLGQAVLERLQAFGFDCAGWSRSGRAPAGVRGFAGPQGLDAFLARTELLVCLLPLTAQTRGLLDASLFARLPSGASLVHVGRGPQLVAADLLAALDSGQLAEAVLDVADPEPLPTGDALWRHPRVRLTPHVASMTQPASAARVVLHNLSRFAAGEPMVGLVDRGLGY